MTRIRRNRSSSRGTQEPEPLPLPCHVVVADEVEMAIEGKAASPTLLQLVDEDAALAAACLKSLEHDVAGFHILEHETNDSNIWDRLVFGGSLLRQGRSERRSRKMLDHFGPERDCVPSGVSSTKERVDEGRAKSSYVALDKVDSYMAVGVEPVAVVVGSKVEHGLLKADRKEMKVGSGGPPLVKRPGSRARTERKKRHRPWDSDSDLALTLNEVRKKVSRDTAIINEDIAERAWDFRSKSEKSTNDQGIGERKKSKLGVKSHKGSLSGRTKLMVKPEKKKKTDSEKPAADSFPLGWKYRGLAQIAEKDRAAQAREDRCGRTDGRLWQCPLKRKQGSSLCEHHLNKFRLKKMYKTRGTAKLPKSDPGVTGSETPDSTVKPCKFLDCDTDTRTRFRRRYKTAKLSIL